MNFPADISAVRKGKCFRCGNEGHWAADCSQKSVRFSQPRQVSTDGGGGGGNGAPAIICKCGAGICEPRVARTEKNSGKVYYTCPAESWMNCNFFMWQSQLKPGGVKQLKYPICSCGAGVCVLDSQYGTGRQYFKCRVPQGQGACSFRQWVNVRVSRSTTKSMDIETSAPRSLGKQANHLLLDKDDSRRKCLKITGLEGSPKTNSDRFSSNSAASLVCSDTKEGSVVSSMELEDLSPEFLREMMEYEYPLFGGDNDKLLKIMELDESPDNPCGQLSSNSVISLASSSGKDVSMLNGVDSEQFEIDQDLISEVMASESTLSHVDQPGEVSNDNQMEEVLETAQMCNDVLFHDYLDCCNHEKLHLEQLVSEHDSVTNSHTRSQAHLQTLQNEAEEVRNRLLQIENKVAASNLEITDLQNHLAELSGQINKCKDDLQSASREAVAAQKIFIQRETELSTQGYLIIIFLIWILLVVLFVYIYM